MRRKLAITSLLATAVLGVPSQAMAVGNPQNPNATTAALSLNVAPNPAVFGFTTVVSGRLTGTNANKNVTVTLEANPYPYTQGLTTVTTTKTDQSGDYSFTVSPAARLHYRTVTAVASSIEKVVWVRLSASFLLGDATPARGALVRFFGYVRPPHGTRLTLIQRRGADGLYHNVASTLAHNVTGRTYAAYSRLLRVFADGRYRVVSFSGDADHLAAISASRFIDVS